MKCIQVANNTSYGGMATEIQCTNKTSNIAWCNPMICEHINEKKKTSFQKIRSVSQLGQ